MTPWYSDPPRSLISVFGKSHRINRDGAGDVHFFSTQVMTRLRENGSRDVVEWTKKGEGAGQVNCPEIVGVCTFLITSRNLYSVDIFEKKFLFMPIHKDMHWSLCVVVNPGKIANMFDSVSKDLEHPWYVLNRLASWRRRH